MRGTTRTDSHEPDLRWKFSIGSPSSAPLELVSGSTRKSVFTLREKIRSELSAALLCACEAPLSADETRRLMFFLRSGASLSHPHMPMVRNRVVSHSST